jgi:hypothetical protein
MTPMPAMSVSEASSRARLAASCSLPSSSVSGAVGFSVRLSMAGSISAQNAARHCDFV